MARVAKSSRKEQKDLNLPQLLRVTRALLWQVLRLPYLVSVHRVLLLQLTLTHCLIFLLIFLQLLGRYLRGEVGERSEEQHVK